MAHMADFTAVIRKAVDGLANNTPENRAKVYEKARGAVVRQLQTMTPQPPAEMLERQISKLDTAIAEVEAAYPRVSTTEIAESPVAANAPKHGNETAQPRVPRQQPGLTFRPDADRGLIASVSSSRATAEEVQDIEGLRSSLIETVDDLLDRTRGTNAYIQINRIAQKYRYSLENENGDLEIDRMYAYGTRLENAAFQLRKRIESDDFPDLDINIAECLDSVLMIHGPTIMSTAAGKDLIAKSREYQSTDSVQDDRYREVALTLWKDARTRIIIVDRDDMEDVIQINADINEAANPSRTTALAHTTNNNLLTTVAKVVLHVSGVVVLKGFENSLLGNGASQSVSALVDGSLNFFVSNKEALMLLANIAGPELSWIEPFIRWLQSKGAERREL